MMIFYYSKCFEHAASNGLSIIYIFHVHDLVAELFWFFRIIRTNEKSHIKKFQPHKKLLVNFRDLVSLYATCSVDIKPCFLAFSKRVESQKMF